jgi:ABC-2 type transport system ATP-binding protein
LPGLVRRQDENKADHSISTDYLLSQRRIPYGAYQNNEHKGLLFLSVIEIQGLKKSFHGRSVLDGISFSIEQGEVFGFLGPNGAGKTTTMRLLLGLLRPDSGKASVLGYSLSDHDAIRHKVGVLLENNGLYERLTAYENLDYFARLYRVPHREERISELLSFVGLSESRNHMVGMLSTGMKRKLGVARAILHDPEILFFDEPSSGLDPEAQHMVRELILELSRRESITIFLNSHNLDEVSRVCSRVAILHRGKIQALDSIQRLTAGTGITTMLITLAHPKEIDTAIAVLSADPQVKEVIQEGDRIRMVLAGKSASPLLDCLIRQGISIEEAIKVSRTLEEIYLDVMRQAEA